MRPPPKIFEGARLVRWSVIDERHRHTQNCRQIVGSELQGAAAGLAICQYDGEEPYYLYGCDA